MATDKTETARKNAAPVAAPITNADAADAYILDVRHAIQDAGNALDKANNGFARAAYALLSGYNNGAWSDVVLKGLANGNGDPAAMRSGIKAALGAVFGETPSRDDDPAGFTSYQANAQRMRRAFGLACAILASKLPYKWDDSTKPAALSVPASAFACAAYNPADYNEIEVRANLRACKGSDLITVNNKTTLTYTVEPKSGGKATMRHVRASLDTLVKAMKGIGKTAKRRGNATGSGQGSNTNGTVTSAVTLRTAAPELVKIISAAKTPADLGKEGRAAAQDLLLNLLHLFGGIAAVEKLDRQAASGAH